MYTGVKIKQNFSLKKLQYTLMHLKCLYLLYYTINKYSSKIWHFPFVVKIESVVCISKQNKCTQNGIVFVALSRFQILSIFISIPFTLLCTSSAVTKSRKSLNWNRKAVFLWFLLLRWDCNCIDGSVHFVFALNIHNISLIHWAQNQVISCIWTIQLF